jgi:inhibitor of KinA sporulation pathway (predicted exonuclease)
LRFTNWLASFKDFAFCSWGDYDRKQLQQDCDFHQCLNPIAAQHLNVKKLFAEKYRIGKPLGLGQAIRKANLTFSGTPHRGIDDARNIARLLPLAIKDPLV